MWLLNRYWLNHRNKGFLLFNLIIGLAVGSILIASLCSIFNYCINASQIAEEKEDLELNGRYAIEYMKKEIKAADEIISIDKIIGYNEKYSKNFGFVIKQKIELKPKKSVSIDKKFEYRYIIYYTNGCYLRRDVVFKKVDILPKANEFSGSNTIVGKVKSIDKSHVDFSNNTIIIKLLFSGKWNRDLEFGTEIYIRSPMNY